ncbi:MAG TPA: hypothetical protein V6D11_00700 [Waterburya sp.]
METGSSSVGTVGRDASLDLVNPSNQHVYTRFERQEDIYGSPQLRGSADPLVEEFGGTQNS